MRDGVAMDKSTETFDAHLNRYELQERIGSGGMAVVYKAFDKQLKRTVAIKILHEHLAADESFRERFEREAQFIASLNHPNIMQIFDFTSREIGDSSMFCMMMPYLPGTTLADELKAAEKKNTRLSQDRISKIGRDLTSALDYAHSHGMIHRDVKPANVLFDDRGRAILTDFGIARLAQGSTLTAEGLIVGTPAYMSPEQATGEDLDGRSDMYSLAVILFEMIAGRLPYPSDGSASVLVKHLNDPVPLISEFLESRNPELDLFFRKALAKSAADRFQTADDMRQAFEDAYCDDTAIASPVSTSDHHTPATVMFANPSITPKDNEQHTTATRIVQTLSTTIVQPVKKNPIGILALAIAAIALLLVARFTQQPAAVLPEEGTPTTAVVENDNSSMTGSLYFETDFGNGDDSGMWELADSSGVEHEIDGNSLVLRNMQDRIASTTLFATDYTYSDVDISLTGQLVADSHPPSAYGIVFRYVDSGNYYVFAVDGQGRYGLWRRAVVDGSAQWIQLHEGNDWIIDSHVNAIGESNALRVVTIGEEIRGYVNGNLLITAHDDALGEGNIGIYTGSTSAANTIVVVSDYAVGPVVPEDEETKANSMTLEN